MRTLIFISFSLLLVTGCQKKNKPPFTKIDKNWLDSLIKNSDSNYTKPYFRTDFVTAAYYFRKKDSSLCQVMLDSQQRVRQVSISVKNIRSFYAQFYSNGQLQAWLPIGKNGQYNGDVFFYNENGKITGSGTYTHGIKTGKWENFNNDGQLTSVDEFSEDGQLIKTK